MVRKLSPPFGETVGTTSMHPQTPVTLIMRQRWGYDPHHLVVIWNQEFSNHHPYSLVLLKKKKKKKQPYGMGLFSIQDTDANLVAVTNRLIGVELPDSPLASPGRYPAAFLWFFCNTVPPWIWRCVHSKKTQRKVAYCRRQKFSHTLKKILVKTELFWLKYTHCYY